MEEDIKKLRPQVDVFIMSHHAGVHFVPATIAMYQKEAAYAAIDAGADLVIQHHAHVLKGVEMYNGKAIFYGLGNFAVEKPLLSRKRRGEPAYRKRYRIEPILNYDKYQRHSDS